MARDLTVGASGAAEAGTVRPAFLYEGEFTGGFVRLWTGVGPLSWDGKTWQGAGELLGMSEIKQSSRIQADGVQLTLSGMPSSLVSLVSGQARQGKVGTIWLAFLDAAGAIIPDPYIAFRGRLDVPEVGFDGETAAITINYESRLVDLQRARERRLTNEDQRIDFPDDRGFEYVPSLQEQVIEW